MKTIKGSEIIDKIKKLVEYDYPTYGLYAKRHVEYSRLHDELEGKILVDEEELREDLESDKGNLMNLSIYNLGAMHGRTQLLKEILK